MDAFRPFETRTGIDEVWAADAGAKQIAPARLAIEAKNRSRVYIAQHCNAGSCLSANSTISSSRPFHIT
jgi:hypothetical protein